MHIAPYVSDQRKKRKKRRKYFLITAAVFILYFIFLGVAWFVAASPVFRMNQIIVKGNDVVASADIVTLVQADAGQHESFFHALLGWNNMLSWPDQISSSNLALIPQLASVSISKDYFAHTITLNVTERNPFGIWCFDGASGRSGATSVVGVANATSSASSTIAISTIVSGSACYWFDENGVIFSRASNTEGNLIFVVNDYSQAVRGLNQNVLPDQFNGNFISIMNVLHQTNLGIKEIDLNDLSLQEIDVYTTNGPKIYFSLRFPANDDLPVLQNLITQGMFNNLQYVDCRTEDRVFYK
jgi:cell division septal protein FtsQ